MEFESLFQAELNPYDSWPKRPIIIYGAGNSGREAYRVLKREGYCVLGFIDMKAESFPQVEGIPCWHPDDPEGFTQIKNEAMLLIAVYNYAVDLELILEAMERKGFSKIISYYEFLERMNVESNLYWFSPRAEVKASREQWRSLEDFWADSKSHSIFLETLKFRLTFDRGLINQPDLHHSYFPLDIPPLPTSLRMIDGGGFTGDTIADLIKNHYQFEALASFEPDPDNFIKLKLTVDQLKLSNSQLFCAGLGSQSEEAHFKLGMNGASGRSEAGERIKIVSIDQALPDFNPNFIKMDIEGSELSALKGVARTISESSCRLAICAYHRPFDLLEIGLELRKNNKKYDYYLRYHGYNGFDLVIYAVPKSHF